MRTIEIGWINAIFRKKTAKKFASSEKSITFASAIERGCLSEDGILEKTDVILNDYMRK